MHSQVVFRFGLELPIVSHCLFYHRHRFKAWQVAAQRNAQCREPLHEFCLTFRLQDHRFIALGLRLDTSVLLLASYTRYITVFAAHIRFSFNTKISKSISTFRTTGRRKADSMRCTTNCFDSELQKISVGSVLLLLNARRSSYWNNLIK